MTCTEVQHSQLSQSAHAGSGHHWALSELPVSGQQSDSHLLTSPEQQHGSVIILLQPVSTRERERERERQRERHSSKHSLPCFLSTHTHPQNSHSFSSWPHLLDKAESARVQDVEWIDQTQYSSFLSLSWTWKQTAYSSWTLSFLNPIQPPDVQTGFSRFLSSSIIFLSLGFFLSRTETRWVLIFDFGAYQTQGTAYKHFLQRVSARRAFHTHTVGHCTVAILIGVSVQPTWLLKYTPD